MSTTPRALGRAKALTVGTMLVAAVATGGVALHLADARSTTAAAGATTVDSVGTSPDTSGTSSQSSSEDDSSSDDDSSSNDDSTTSGSASSTTSNGFAPVAPPAPAQAPAQSSTNGS